MRQEFNSGSTGFAADFGATRTAAAALGRMVGRAALGALGIGIGSSPVGPETLGKDTARETVGTGMTEVVGRRTTAVMIVGLSTVVGAAVAGIAAAVLVVGRHCGSCEVVGVVASTVKSIVVTADYDWGCSRCLVDLVNFDRTGHSYWLAHRFRFHSHCRRSRSRRKVVFGTGSHTVCCTDNCCSRDALGSSHSRRIGHSTVAGSTVVGSTVAGSTVVGSTAVGTVVDMGVADTVDRAEGRCCLKGNKVCDMCQLEKGTCVPGSKSRYQWKTLLLSPPFVAPQL